VLKLKIPSCNADPFTSRMHGPFQRDSKISVARIREWGRAMIGHLDKVER
jgi:hypothetical protein